MGHVFISYSRREAEPARALHGVLVAAGAEVFLDTEGIDAGADFVGRLQSAVGGAARLVLLASPAAMASEWVRNEVHGFIAKNPDFLRLGRLIPVATHAATPLPVILGSVNLLDATQGASFLAKLFAALELTTPPPNVPIPWPIDPLAPLRADLYRGVGDALKKARDRKALAVELGLDPNALENWGSDGLTANAALVRATGESDPVPGARRLIEAVQRTFADEPDVLVTFSALAARLPTVRPDEDRLITAWKESVVHDHGDLVHVFRKGHRVVIDEVYVDPTLWGDASPLFDGGLGIRGKVDNAPRQPSLRDILSLPRGGPTSISGRWVVKGDPGSGKTTLLRHLAWQLAKEPDPPWIPLYVSLPSLIGSGMDIMKRAVRRMAQRGQPGADLALEALGLSGRLLVLLDGLDEVPASERDQAVMALQGLSERWPDATLVVSSRPIGYRHLGATWRELRLLPFDEKRQHEFLANWFGGEDGPKRATQVLASLAREVGDLATNPLYLTLVALLVESGAPPSAHRAVLYDQVFELLLQGRQRELTGDAPGRARVLDTALVARGLRHIGRGMTEANHDADTQADIEAMLPEELIRRIERVYKRHGGLDGFAEDLTVRSAILGPYADDPQVWRWWHRSFREAWAARALHHEVLVRGGAPADVREALCPADSIVGAQTVEPERAAWEAQGAGVVMEAAARIVGSEGQWAEPFALLSGRLVDPDALLHTLAKVNRPLALRALGSARRVSAETVREIVGLATDPDERRQAYLTVAEKVGEPERAAELLLRLAGDTTEADDLYLLDVALRQLAQTVPDGDGRERIAASRARVYAHLPAPDVGALGAAATVRVTGGSAGTEAPLWAVVPAGKGKIGGTKHTDERPTFRIQIDAPFRLMSVPVTNRMWQAFQPDHRPRSWPGVSAGALLDHPVVDVSWYAAAAFCQWLARRVPGVRLPTEFEWEVACRGGTRGDWWCNEAELDTVAWTDRNAGGRTHAVGELRANPWGLFDIHGNVWEWTASPWTANHAEAARSLDPRVPPGDVEAAGAGRAARVIRGGSWSSGPGRARSACRGRSHPTNRGRYVGFRVLLPVPG